MGWDVLGRGRGTQGGLQATHKLGIITQGCGPSSHRIKMQQAPGPHQRPIQLHLTRSVSHTRA